MAKKKARKRAAAKPKFDPMKGMVLVETHDEEGDHYGLYIDGVLIGECGACPLDLGPAIAKHFGVTFHHKLRDGMAYPKSIGELKLA